MVQRGQLQLVLVLAGLYDLNKSRFVNG